MKKFKPTTELDMSVFEPDRILDYADLFISTGKKPSFSKGNKTEESSDPFDDMMDEAADKEKADEQKIGL